MLPREERLGRGRLLMVQQAAATVCAYLKGSSDQERQAAAKLVVQAFKQAYPCQGGSR